MDMFAIYMIEMFTIGEGKTVKGELVYKTIKFHYNTHRKKKLPS